MNSNKYTTRKTQTTTNLIGDTCHRHFLNLQASYGFSQRGGVQFPNSRKKHNVRLVSDVNILTQEENKHFIFSESIFSN